MKNNIDKKFFETYRRGYQDGKSSTNEEIGALGYILFFISFLGIAVIIKFLSNHGIMVKSDWIELKDFIVSLILLPVTVTKSLCFFILGFYPDDIIKQDILQLKFSIIQTALYGLLYLLIAFITYKILLTKLLNFIDDKIYWLIRNYLVGQELESYHYKKYRWKEKGELLPFASIGMFLFKVWSIIYNIVLYYMIVIFIMLGSLIGIGILVLVALNYVLT
ncbi:hypothetical protein V7149_17085 [Bacillus sp. JJ1503]|uniref:hypothetical protein n=1 Tax=Bacillus sp. JJ1503 TaxID=3122956 RepID=UPI0030008C77